jgi:cellulose synthase/poly-beta-1,6-N-acetylglucosamine synthase-like glycosyltransferase
VKMSALWPWSRAGSDTTTSNSEPWRPVKIIQIDIDAFGEATPPGTSAGDRLWVEAVRQGQVVGVLDTFVDENGWPPSGVKDLSTRFSEVPLSTYMKVDDDRLAKASIVVPTICENSDELLRTVRSLLALDYPDFEIVVVDNRSSEERTPLPEFSDARVRTVSERTRGASAARNKGIAISTGDFVAFTDDDAVVDQKWLRVLGARFAVSEEVEAIGGLVLPTELETAAQLWFEEYYGGFSPSFSASIMSVKSMAGLSPLFPYAPGVFGAGCNMAFRRTTLQRMGGFNTLLGPGTPTKGGEDPALFVKLALSGARLAFEPAALVRHTHRHSKREFMTQVFGYGTGLTAMYTSLVARDPRQLLAILRRFPAGFRLLTLAKNDRSSSPSPSYPRHTIIFQLLGMAYGPLAYVRSVAQQRWSP